MFFLGSANDWIGAQLGAASGPFAFGLLLLSGALASLLPCVYPIYPITAVVLSRRTSSLGRFAHPLVYYAGLASTYFALGLVASMSGGAFNELLRLPAANLALGLLLIVLGFATLGWLHFPTLQDSGGERGEGLVHTCIMGAGAGLLSSACVGPVVVGILVGLAANAGALSFGTVLLAASKMLVFGMGVGLPFLAIGVFGLSLPRGGRWMVWVQALFATAIGYFALGYLVKGLEGLGLESASGAILSGFALLFVGVFFVQSADRSTNERTRVALAAALAVGGFSLILRSVVPTQGAPMATTPGPPSQDVETSGGLTWHFDKAAAYAAAARSGKPVFVDFHGDWCTNCKAFQEKTQADAALNQALREAVLLKVYDTSPLFQEYKADARFPELKVGLPFFVITDALGNVIYKTSDFTKTDEMVLFLDG